MAQQEQRQCKACGEVKPLSEYQPLPSGNYRITCKACRRITKNAARRAKKAAEWGGGVAEWVAMGIDAAQRCAQRLTEGLARQAAQVR